MIDKTGKKRSEKFSERTGETREKILNAAIRLFSRKGYRGTSVADIATEAGVAKSAVLWRFGTKNGQNKGVFLKEWLAEDIAWLIRILTAGAFTYWYRDPSNKPSTLYGIIRRVMKNLLVVDTEKWPVFIEKEIKKSLPKEQA